MSGAESLRLGAEDFVLLSERERVSLIFKSLGSLGFDPEALLYCGVDASHDGRFQDPSSEQTFTFGVTHNRFMDLAQGIDEGDTSSNRFSYPLYHALRAIVIRPAIVTYRRDMLVARFDGDDAIPDDCVKWVHLDGGPVDKAAQATVFIEDRSLVPSDDAVS